MAGLSRRQFLGALGAGAVLSGCGPALDRVLAQPSPQAGPITASQRAIHLLKRTTWGVTPPLLAEVEQMGVEAWIAAQLNYESVADWQTELRLRRFDTLLMTPPDLLGLWRERDVAYVTNELASATVMRALFSRRQLYEMLVYFWTNHFNIYHFKDETAQLKTIDDREVIRRHALGNFGNLLTASAHSPAMLVYLDNIANRKDRPNENYAREIMELHTLGVDGAYTEDDVKEVARCFTGWTVADNGRFEFRAGWHDEGEKVVLGQTIPAGGGKDDGDRVLQILIDHPDTARYVCYRLAQRFVADEPSPVLVSDLVQAWQTGREPGDIRRVMGALLSHEAFWNAPPKFKLPLELALSAMRSLRATYNGRPPLVRRLNQLGQRPFNYATPDGYPEIAAEWSGSLTQRWNFAIDLVSDGIGGVRVPLQEWLRFGRGAGLNAVGQAVLLRDLTSAEREAILSTVETDNPNLDTVRGVLGLLLSSPGFQWR